MSLRLNRPETNKPSRSLGKKGILKLLALIITGVVAIIGSMFYRNWTMSPGSPKEYTPSSQYKKDVIQGEKDKKDFDEIIKKIEARKQQEEKEFKLRGQNQMVNSQTSKQPIQTSKQQIQPGEPEPKMGKVKLSTKTPVYETGSTNSNNSTGQDSPISYGEQPIQPIQPQQPKKPQQKMVKYNDWVDEVPEVKDPMSQTQDKVIQEEGLLRKDSPSNSSEDTQRQF